MKAEITVVENELNQEVYIFVLASGGFSSRQGLFLEVYLKQARKTKRHKWKNVDSYLRHVNNRVVDVPEKVELEVKTRFYKWIKDLKIS